MLAGPGTEVENSARRAHGPRQERPLALDALRPGDHAPVVHPGICVVRLLESRRRRHSLFVHWPSSPILPWYVRSDRSASPTRAGTGATDRRARWPSSCRSRRSGCSSSSRPPRRRAPRQPRGAWRWPSAPGTSHPRSPAKPQQPASRGTTTSAAQARAIRSRSADRFIFTTEQTGCRTTRDSLRRTCSAGSSVRAANSTPSRIVSASNRVRFSGVERVPACLQAVGARAGVHDDRQAALVRPAPDPLDGPVHGEAVRVDVALRRERHAAAGPVDVLGDPDRPAGALGKPDQRSISDRSRGSPGRAPIVRDTHDGK